MSTAVKSPSKSAETVVAGMGSIPHENGVAFRVWAPHANAVSVVGTFNGWEADAHTMQSEENGFWYLSVPEAKVGDEYQYVVTNGDQELHRMDPYAREVTNSVGNSIVCDSEFDWDGDDFILPPINELVIYELHAGTFHVESEGQPGSLESVITRLEHLKRLGVNAIELMPTAEFAGDYSWGYNPAHIFAVESSYGGPKALKKLVREAHRLGIGVILDVVYNHFGPSDLDQSLWQFDGWHENGKGGIYFYNDWRAQTPWGETRPDYGRGEVRQYIRDNAIMWLEDYHLDGLRYDMTLYMRTVQGEEEISEGWGLTQWINSEIRERFPNKITIAEDLQNNEWLTKSTDVGGAGFHAQWDAKFVHPIRAAVIASDDANRNMHKVCDSLLSNYNGDPFQRVVYSESHDEVANGKQRVPSEVAPDDDENRFAQKRSTLAAAMVFTAPGVPMIMQGQEFLETGWFDDGDPLDWDRSEEFAGIVKLYSDLIQLRLNHAGTTRGLTGSGIDIIRVDNEHKVIAYRRSHSQGPGDDVVVIANFSDQPLDDFEIGFPAEGTWRLRLNSDFEGYSETFDDQESVDVEAVSGDFDGLPAHASVSLASYAVLIFSQDPA